MDGDFSPEQKKLIGDFVQWQLKRNRITQKQIALGHGCSEAAVSRAISQGQLHESMPKLKNYIARKAGYSGWVEICAEALAQEEVGA